MSNLHTNSFKTNFEKIIQYIGGQWLIHGTYSRNDNKLQTLNSPVEYHIWEYQFSIKDSSGNMFCPKFQTKVQGQKHPGRWAIAELSSLVSESLNL